MIKHVAIDWLVASVSKKWTFLGQTAAYQPVTFCVNISFDPEDEYFCLGMRLVFITA